MTDKLSKFGSLKIVHSVSWWPLVATIAQYNIAGTAVQRKFFFPIYKKYFTMPVSGNLFSFDQETIVHTLITFLFIVQLISSMSRYGQASGSVSWTLGPDSSSVGGWFVAHLHWEVALSAEISWLSWPTTRRPESGQSIALSIWTTCKIVLLLGIMYRAELFWLCLYQTTVLVSMVCCEGPISLC